MANSIERVALQCAFDTIQKANLLFMAIEEVAEVEGNLKKVLLLAQIGAEVADAAEVRTGHVLGDGNG